MQICNSCHAGCCRNYAVGLTGYDILNISNTLGIDPVSFIQIIPVLDDTDAEYKARHAALFKFAGSGDNNYYMFGMRMAESQLVQGTIKCHFLMEWFIDPINPVIETIIARCGIYNCRPLTCSTFPTKFDDTEKRAVILNLSSNSKSDEHPIYNVCPEKFSKDEIKDSSDNIINSLIKRKYELDFFKSLASYWNQNPGSIEEFFTFMTKAYQTRVTIG